ncbi:pur operon repressor [Tenuibacillus multivorans]|uniref:Purine operon repressor n=1 Tax=Tenuibacillus multivorans TaxID=237069 RepID=A0A1G9VZU8_9BACI|nr:pur operon repressor [Tenuibacillus multivorans]GEL78263.1 pur operon repressor [Tenuibacillus multivorans]SDM77829.1 purine operon repressor [Tenuibacillus multivorans]
MKRSERLVGMTHFFLENPKQLFSLPFFVEQYDAAKSSISEDMDIIDGMFKNIGIGELVTVAGAAGGVQYIPSLSKNQADHFMTDLIEHLEDPSRILPGGYVYMSDILGEPKYIREIGKIFASAFQSVNADYVVTVATKGIPLAYAVAQVLDIPVVIIRRDPKVTEGSTVSINYVSGSSRKIQTMVLAKRSIKEGSNVIIVDDFMKAGGTIHGMISLMHEFNANVQGIGVLAEAEDEEEDRKVEQYTSLLKFIEVNEDKHAIRVKRGNYF